MITKAELKQKQEEYNNKLNRTLLEETLERELLRRATEDNCDINVRIFKREYIIAGTLSFIKNTILEILEKHGYEPTFDEENIYINLE